MERAGRIIGIDLGFHSRQLWEEEGKEKSERMR